MSYNGDDDGGRRGGGDRKPSKGKGKAKASSRDDLTASAVFGKPIVGHILEDEVDPHQDEYFTSKLDSAVPLEALIVKPNVNDGDELPDQIMDIVNSGTGGLRASRSMFGTTVVEAGRMGLLSYNGCVQIVGPGRWRKLNPRASWAGIVSLTDNPIQHQTLTIVRVPKGQYGLATDNSKPVLLAEGVHVRNSRLFQHVGFQAINQKHIQHSTIHILLVPKGEYALVVEKGQPKVLQPGFYVVDSSVFNVAGFVPINQEHIQHNTIHIIQVPKGKVGLIAKNNKMMLIHEGMHVYNSQIFQYSGLKDINRESIVHGTITRVRVRNGEIGLAWQENKPVLIEEPGFYEFDSPNFQFVKCVPATDKEIVLGSNKRIMVYDGEVGVSYRCGKLCILEPKTHYFDSTDWIFTGFLSTRQQCLSLSDRSPDGLLRCDTKDFVEIGIKSDVFYKVADPQKALLEVGSQEAINSLVIETAIATLQSIIRSSSLNQVAQSKEPHAISEEKYLEQQAKSSSSSSSDSPSAPLFFDKVHDEFISKLHDYFLQRYGLEIANIRIESFKILDEQLVDNISKQALITATTETKLANLEGQKEIATAEVERDAEVARIKTQSMAQQLATDTAARNKATMDEATAKAQAAKIRAQGEAEALLITVEAEARAIELKGEAEARAQEKRAMAEAKRAELLASTPLGGQLAMFALQTDMVAKSMQGIEKVVYLPTNGTSNSPFGLFNMPMMGIDPAFNMVNGASSSRQDNSKKQLGN